MDASKPYQNIFEALEDDQAIAENLIIRAKLMDLLREKIKEKGLPQAEAARKLSVSQPRISDLMRGKIDRFTIDMLVNMLSRIDVHVELCAKAA